MFEAAELGHEISKETYNAALPKLRAELLEAHLALRKTNISVVVIVSGADGAGKGEVVHRLNEWLDPRGVETQAFWKKSDEERERPPYWRFWRALPSHGRVAIFFGSWYSEPIIQRVYGKTKNSDLDAGLERIAFFERMLVADGALIIKLWYHLPKKVQHQQLKDLAKDVQTQWRLLPSDWKHHKLYDKFIDVSERAIRHTDTSFAPWHLVEATDRRYRELATGEILLNALKQRIKNHEEKKRPLEVELPAPVLLIGKRFPTILDRVKLNRELSDEEYKKELEKYQSKLTKLSWAANKKEISAVALFEGWDAAGKGSAIRRVTQAIDPRLYRVVPIAAPTDEERSHHYLWRFWRGLPRAGMLTIYDRSWYGRVLVERVEKLASNEEWNRAYLEINDFEEQLVEQKILIGKFWIHISKEEQLRRFKHREAVPFKRFKITEEDWRNRKQWNAYKRAVNDMVAHTSTEFAPWTLVAGNDKKYARIQILKTLCKLYEKAL